MATRFFIAFGRHFLDSLVLRAKQVPAWHAHYARLYAVAFQLLLRRHAERYLRAGPDQQHLGRAALRFRKNIGPMTGIAFDACAAQVGNVLPGQRE